MLDMPTEHDRNGWKTTAKPALQLEFTCRLFYGKMFATQCMAPLGRHREMAGK
jgi:hypothetical protein